MWKTIKLKFAMYKWAILFIGFAALSMTVVWQYSRISVLEAESTQLVAEREQLKKDVKSVTDNFNNFKDNTNQALEDIETLRSRIQEINQETSNLRGQLARLNRGPIIPGDNVGREQLENDVNEFTDKVFTEIEAASNTTKGSK